MVDVCQQLIRNQYEAAFCTLNACVDRCPDELWEAPVVNLKFCQVVFHTLIFADLYLGTSEKEVKAQPFHHQHADYFRDYEEFQDRPQRLLYDRPTTRLYLAHCRDKAAEQIESATAESLAAWCGFPLRNFSRAELHVYNIRHVEHHAAQLSLRLRQDTGDGVPWVGSGWRDL